MRRRPRRWADSGSTAPLVLPPQSYPMDTPADKKKHTLVMGVSTITCSNINGKKLRDKGPSQVTSQRWMI